MKIDIGKTELMIVCTRPGGLKINLKGTELKQVSELKYVGSTFAEDGRCRKPVL